MDSPSRFSVPAALVRRSPRLFSRLLAQSVVIAAVLCGCSDGGTTGRSRVVVEVDTRPAFTLDGSKPFVIEFGRGSGLYGLDIIKINDTGTVDLHRITGGPNGEATSLSLPAARMKELVDLVNSSHLTGMGRTYSADMADGTQWVFWIQQSPAEKSIYFNNAFPAEISGFAGRLDAILQNAGLGSATWVPVAPQEASARQTALWGRIRPAPAMPAATTRAGAGPSEY